MNVSDHEECQLTSSRPSGQTQTIPNDRISNAGGEVYEQLVTAGRPQVLPTGDVRERNAAFHHVLWSCGLQTPVDSCTQLELHSLRNIQSVQLLV